MKVKILYTQYITQIINTLYIDNNDDNKHEIPNTQSIQSTIVCVYFFIRA